MEAFAYFSSLLSILFIFILVFWLYRGYRIDSFRQKVFLLRDQFFDEGRKGVIPFESNAYGMIRSTINGTIRFGHRISLWQMVTFILLVKSEDGRREKTFSERLDLNLKGMTSEQVKVIKEYHLRLNFLLLEHILLSSPLILLTVIIPVAFFAIAKRHITKAISPFTSPLDKFDSAALAIGKT